MGSDNYVTPEQMSKKYDAYMEEYRKWSYGSYEGKVEIFRRENNIKQVKYFEPCKDGDLEEFQKMRVASSIAATFYIY